ncbi:LytTR family DNA-binding domain-containing protein [Tenacibaculum xiamenense]|uniref:LytTR family DNA-binding domain-containing protein n=1 Tax=Tenacibaculum xiamenense TaxID=1261553 RepID=UPI003894EABA
MRLLKFIFNEHHRPKHEYPPVKTGIKVFMLSYLFLFIFSPFSLKKHPTIIQHAVVFSYSFISAITVGFVVFFLALRAKLKWTYFDDIKLVFFSVFIIYITAYPFTIKLLNPLLNSYITNDTFKIPNNFALDSFVYLITIGFIVYGVLSFVSLLNFTFIKKTTQEKIIKTAQANPNKITFIGKNKQDRLTILAVNCIYIQSQGHYVNILYHDTENLIIKKSTLRMNMTQVQLCLQNTSSIVRCHKSYFINTLYIKRIKFDGSKYKISLKNLTTVIPISKAKLNLVKTNVVNS